MYLYINCEYVNCTLVHLSTRLTCVECYTTLLYGSLSCAELQTLDSCTIEWRIYCIVCDCIHMHKIEKKNCDNNNNQNNDVAPAYQPKANIIQTQWWTEWRALEFVSWDLFFFPPKSERTGFLDVYFYWRKANNISVSKYSSHHITSHHSSSIQINWCSMFQNGWNVSLYLCVFYFYIHTHRAVPPIHLIKLNCGNNLR